MNIENTKPKKHLFYNFLNLLNVNNGYVILYSKHFILLKKLSKDLKID